MMTFRAVCKPALIAGVAFMVLLSGCSGGASAAELAQAKQAGVDAQVQKDAIKAQEDTQATLSAQVEQLKDDAAKAAEVKVSAEKVASAKAAAEKRAALKVAASAKAAEEESASSQPQRTSCDGNVSAGGNTTCGFAMNVETAYYQSGGGYSTVDAYSPVTGLYYSMTCQPGVPTVCRGGDNAVVYIR